jgi:hypothetical protein
MFHVERPGGTARSPASAKCCRIALAEGRRRCPSKGRGPAEAALVGCSTWNSRHSASADGRPWAVVSHRRMGRAPVWPFGFPGAARRRSAGPALDRRVVSTWNTAQRARWPCSTWNSRRSASADGRPWLVVSHSGGQCGARIRPRLPRCHRPVADPPWIAACVPRGTAGAPRQRTGRPAGPLSATGGGGVGPDGSCSSQVQRTAVADWVCMPRSEQPLLHIRGWWLPPAGVPRGTALSALVGHGRRLFHVEQC